MINVEIDKKTQKRVEKALGDLSNKSPTVIKDVLNDTARWSQQKLAKKARETYTVKAAGFKRAMPIKRATASHLEAVIKTHGEQISLYKFKAKASSDGAKVAVVKGSLKTLVKFGNKAFVNNIAAKGQTRKKDTNKGKKGSSVNHIAVAVRQGKKRLKIAEVKALSIPQMIGSEKHVYGLIQPDINKVLLTKMNNRIARMIKSS